MTNKTLLTPDLALLAAWLLVLHTHSHTVAREGGGFRTNTWQRGGGRGPSSVGPGTCVQQPLPTSQNSNLYSPSEGSVGWGGEATL